MKMLRADPFNQEGFGYITEFLKQNNINVKDFICTIDISHETLPIIGKIHFTGNGYISWKNKTVCVFDDITEFYKAANCILELIDNNKKEI